MNRTVVSGFITLLLMGGINGFVDSQTTTSLPDSKSFRLSISPPVRASYLGQPVILRVKMTNISGKDLYIVSPPGLGWGNKLVDVDLIDSHGRATTKWRDLAPQRSGTSKVQLHGSFETTILHPQEDLEVDVHLESILKIVAADTYTARVMRMDSTSGAVVTSDAVTVSILQSH